jgi:DNA invertase Pin-like site-specific DNA recombinase
MKPAAQYLRMSSDHQRYSIENQTAVIADHAASNGFEIVRSYIDAGRSGLTTAGREGLKALLRDVVARPPFATILVADVSRWGRYQDPDEGAHYEHICREAGVQVEYCAEPFVDDGTPASALIKNLKRVMAGEYSRQLSDRCRAGVRRTILSGHNGGGCASFGFTRQAFAPDGTPGTALATGEIRRRADERVRIVPGDEDELRTLRRIFELYVRDQRGLREIAFTLNSEGVPHSRPGVWTFHRVRAVLVDERAVGVCVFNRSFTHLGQFHRLKKDQWMKLQVSAPLVSRAVFDAAAVRLVGFKPKRYSEAELLVKLRRLLKTHGYLSPGLVNRSRGVPDIRTYVSRFGSATAAFARAGFALTSGSRDVRRSSEDIIAALKLLYQTHGYLSATLIDASSAVPCAANLRRRFGSLQHAYDLVGYPADLGSQLKGAWVRRRQKAAQIRAQTSAPLRSGAEDDA